MFNIIDLYQLFKPDSNPNLITSYPLIFGGSNLNLNQVTGGFVISQISSQAIGSPSIRMVKNDGAYSKVQSSLIENVFQVDFYKQYDINDNGMNIPYLECSNLMEFLKTYECLEYLQNIGCEVLPNYSTISITSEFTELKELINRGSFDFSIISKTSIILDTIALSKVEFEKGIII